MSAREGAAPGQADPWQVIADVTSALLLGGQTASIRCPAALRVLDAAGIDFSGNPVKAAAAAQPAPQVCDSCCRPLAAEAAAQPAPEVRHWDGAVNQATGLINWILASGGTARYHDGPSAIVIDMPRGTVTAVPGDWIVRMPDNTFRVLSEDVQPVQPAPVARQALEEAVERAIHVTPAGSGTAAVMRAVDAYVSARSREAQAALARVLSWFAEEPVVSSRRYASATRAQLARAYQDGGLDMPDKLRKFL